MPKVPPLMVKKMIPNSGSRVSDRLSFCRSALISCPTVGVRLPGHELLTPRTLDLCAAPTAFVRRPRQRRNPSPGQTGALQGAAAYRRTALEHSGPVQPGDLCRPQAQHLGKDLVGVLTEGRRTEKTPAGVASR